MAELFSFRDMPIGRKLLILWLSTMGVMLVGLALLSIGQEVVNWRSRSAHELTSNAKIIAANIAPALLFNDRAAASETLSALSAAPNIVFAAVYGADGARFAGRGDAIAGPASRPPGAPLRESSFTSSALIVGEPIIFKGERIGSIYLKSDLRELYAEVARSSLVTLIVAIAVFGAASVVLRGLLNGLVRPISQLSGVMARISDGGAYALRAPDLGGGDEVGVLARGFNVMLEGIQERDARLDQSNIDLQAQLTQRAVAQDALRAHDAMLKAVAHGAGQLLGSLDLDAAAAGVLELIGRTLSVGRVQLGPIVSDRDGRLRSSARYEWRAPGLPALVDDPTLQNMDISTSMPTLSAGSLIGERTALTLPKDVGALRQLFAKFGATSILFTPVMADGKLWGGLWFIDSAITPRVWNWAETDTLDTLAVLIGVSTTRSQQVRELADANTIVQNSPTVLYKLKGQPDLPLTYLSKNVARFGYDPQPIIAAATGFKALIERLVHPDDRSRVLEAMARLMAGKAGAGSILMRMVLPSGEYRWFENSYSPLRDALGRLSEVDGSVTDITERKLAEDKIALLARTDGLTGLANRATFIDRLHQAYAAARRGAGPFAVLYLDIDHFKDINDTRGHPIGDLMLREAASRLQGRVRDTDLVARMGGDEFAVLQADTSVAADSGVLAAAIVTALAVPFVIDGDEMRVTASVGISQYNPDVAGPDAMLAQADIALYRAKDAGRDQYRFHSAELDDEVRERVAISEDLRKGIEGGQLDLHYQPQVELTSGRIVGMEALVRWRHPTRGLLQPAAFIPIAETSGVIRDLGRWVLESACRQMTVWRQAGVAPPTVAVNVSMLELKTGEAYVKDVADILAKTGLEPRALELDITESMMAKANFANNDVIGQLQALGVKIALDNVGADYSSFDYVRAYKVNHLKVGRQFIEKATRDPEQAATVRAIIGVGHDMGIPVIAEGVETDEQRKLLLALDADTLGQGFLFSEPVELARATDLLKQGSIQPTGPTP